MGVWRESRVAVEWEGEGYCGCAKEAFMAIPRFKLSFSDLFWAMLALFGCLAMLAFEAVSFRLAVGKW
jgi:hypothetical protein